MNWQAGFIELPYKICVLCENYGLSFVYLLFAICTFAALPRYER